MAFDDIWKVTIFGRIESQVQQNILHYRTSVEGGDPENDVGPLALVATEVLAPAYIPITLNNWVLEEIQIRGITRPTEGIDVLIGTAGNKLGDPLPLQNAAVLSLKTLKIGRSFRGRLYLPTAGEDDQSSGVWGGTYTIQVGTFGAAIRTVEPTTPGTYQAKLVVWSRKLQESTDVVSLGLDPVSGTQRSRRQGVGS